MSLRIRALMVTLILTGCDSGTATTGDTKTGVVANADTTPHAAGSDPKKDPAATLPDATALLEKSVVAQGGREKFDALTSLYLEGEATIAAQKISGALKLWWQAGDFYVEQQMIGIGTMRAGKQGDVIWTDDPINGLRELSGAEAEQQAWASSPSLPAYWKQYFDKAETTGQRELAGKKVYDVQLTSKSGSTVTLTLDAESGLQVAQSFKQVTPMGEVPLTIELQDYREVGGITLPFLQVTDLLLTKATQTLTKVEFGVPVDTTKFAKPKAGTAVVKPLAVPEPGAGPEVKGATKGEAKAPPVAE